MSKPVRQPDPAAPDEDAPSFLRKLPWESITIWGLLLLVIYSLRHFFFVIFITFILTYIMRSVIVRILRFANLEREVPWLERCLAVVCFLLLFLALYGAGSYLQPHLNAQYLALEGRVKRFNPEREGANLGAKTIGAYLFRRKYGDRDDESYQTVFREFAKDKPRRVVAYEGFKTLIGDVEGGLVEREKGEIQPEVERQFAVEGAFGDWFLSEQAPLLYAAKRDEYIRKFESKLRTVLQEDYEKYRDKFILSEILDEVNSDVAQQRTSEELFRQSLVESLLAKRRESPGYEPQRRAGLEKQYELMKKGNSVRYSYSFEQYLQLGEAHRRSEAAFAEALAEVTDLDDQDPEEQFHEAFVYKEQRELWQTWWDTFSQSEEFRETVKNYREEAMGAIGTWVQGALGFIFKLTVQLPLSLLLAFIITFSFPKLRQGVKKLEKSRISGFYAEVAPGLTSFGHLIGRAFQAQGVIAVFNTLLTFLAVRLLGIENEVFLCVIVFFCSFIPVVGVVLSSVPIAAMAIVQPGGSVIVALEITAAILVIHFIETTVLNPKILGDMLHLHPVMVLAVLAIAGHYFGAWGLLLGVPVAVYIIRFVILDEGIPGLIEPTPGRAAVAAAGHPGPGDARALAVEREDPGSTKEAPQVDKESDERMSPAAHHGEEASASAGPKSARTVRAKD